MNDSVYRLAGRADAPASAMTLGSTVAKTGILLVILMIAASYTWAQTMHGAQGLSGGLIGVGAIGGLIVALITVFRPQVAPITAPIYAALEGLLLGAISAATEAQYPGIAIQAVGLCVGVLAIMLFHSTARASCKSPREAQNRHHRRHRSAGFIFYVVQHDIRGVRPPDYNVSRRRRLSSVGFSVVVVAIAAFNLLLDFDFIDKGVQQQAPKYMEWYGGFSLMVTLVWMYLEMLRLLSKLRGRD